MFKKIAFVIVFASLLLAACQPAAPAATEVAEGPVGQAACAPNPSTVPTMARQGILSRAPCGTSRRC